MGWCFAVINGKLAEIFFEKKRGITKLIGHAYVKNEEYKTKKEQKYIEDDTAKFHFSYRNKIYKDLNTSKKFKSSHISDSKIQSKALASIDQFREKLKGQTLDVKRVLKESEKDLK